MSLILTPGQDHDGRQFEAVCERLVRDNVREAAGMDRGYDADRIRERLELDGIESVIPPISTRSRKLHYDHTLYKERNRIERFFGKIKQFRRIATRCDKLANSFFSFVCLAAAFFCIRNS